jgi:LPS O-antigen subunit length determinant protein (WzzB/FepE family)
VAASVSRDRVGSDLADRASPPHYVTLLGLCNDVLRGRWTIAVLVACCAIAPTVVRLVEPRTYTARASFVPDAVRPLEGAPAPLSGLDLLGGAALQSGSVRSLRPTSGGLSSAVPNGPALEPLDTAFYSILLRSPAFITAIAGSQFTFAGPGGTRTGTAADAYGLPPGPTERRLDDAARRLAREIESTSNDSSVLVRLSVRTFDPQFARSATERVLDALLAQNRRMANARAAAQVADLTRATQEARSELTVAQTDFARFLASNRAFVDASAVALEFRRRDADVVEKRRHYAELALQLERARLDASRAGQLIAIVERPETPVRPDPRGVVRTFIIGGVGGGALAVLIVLIGAHLRRLRASGFDDLAALEAEWRTVRPLVQPLPRGRRPGATSLASGEAG